ncbi:MAG: 4'-phosphopantetheinyl transferase superfamily protein [Rhodobacterales bacterium]|nr:4'-phosphopantetheinyl transferase superfamily protein [Rhodobacterales bacterium]
MITGHHPAVTESWPVVARGDSLDRVAESLPAAGAAHLWLLDLTGDPEPDMALLDADERTRSAAAASARGRRRFALRRQALRHLLAAYGGLTAADVAYAVGPWGRPRLAAAPPRPVRFNASHAGDWGLVALTRDRDPGVDLEALVPHDDLDAVARRYFADRERADLAALAPADRLAGFYRAWTRKEALIKAWGEGLSHPLDAFAVSLAAGEPPRLRWLDHGRRPGDGWALAHLDPAPGYVGALALPGAAPAVSGFRLAGPGVRQSSYDQNAI